MPIVQPIELYLPQDIIASMNRAVEAGEYANTSDIVCAALLQWRFWRDQPLASVEELKALVEEGLESGIAKPFTFEELLENARRLTPGSNV